MQKLIKLSEVHYIIVDDSELKEGVKCLVNGGLNRLGIDNFQTNVNYSIKPLKVTHSTQPLNEQCQAACSGFCINCPDTSVKRLDLLEIEELVYGCNIEKMAYNRAIERKWNPDSLETRRVAKEIIEAVKFGFKAHQELVKDKLFSIEDIDMAYIQGRCDESTVGNKKKMREDFLKSLLPKTEWNIEIDEQGKIILL